MEPLVIRWVIELDTVLASLLDPSFGSLAQSIDDVFSATHLRLQETRLQS